MERESVSSSLVESVGYDPDEEILEVALERRADIPVQAGAREHLPGVSSRRFTWTVLQPLYSRIEPRPSSINDD